MINGRLRRMRKKKEFGMKQKKILKEMQREYIENGGINIRNHSKLGIIPDSYILR